MTKGYFIGDVMDIIAGSLCLSANSNASPIASTLDTIYLAVVIISVLFGLVCKIITVFKDGKISPEEMKELQDELAKTKKQLEELKHQDEEEKPHE